MSASPQANQEEPSARTDDIAGIKQQDWLVKSPLHNFACNGGLEQNELFLLFMGTLTVFFISGLMGAAGASIVFAGSGWAAIDRGASCDALARSVLVASKGRVQATAGFSFTPDRRRWGEFHAHLSRVPRAGSSVMLSIGDQPFLLVARGDWAWSRGPRQEQAIMAAARNASAMRVEARDGAGRRFVDTYALGGAPTAIDAAAAACAGKMQPR